MYAIAIFLTYNLQFYVPFTLLWPRICRKILYKYNDKAKAKFEHAFRIGLILVTCKLKDYIKSDYSLFIFSYYCCINSKSWSCDFIRYIISAWI